MKTILNFIAAVALGSSVMWLSGCFTSSDTEPFVTSTGFGETPTSDILPHDPAVNGSALFCDSAPVYLEGDDDLQAPAAPNDPDAPDDTTGIPRWNISKTPDEPNIGNNVKRLAAAVLPMTPGGDTYQTTDSEADNYLDLGDDTLVHPMVVSYSGQVIGDYSLGEGSADIGDPDNIDEIFVALSLDNGKTWKDTQVSDSALKSSIQVSWDGETIQYPGHSHKSTLAVQTVTDPDDPDVKHHYLLVAWLDKYCPSGDPFGLDDDVNDDGTIYQDYFKVNGNQGSIDYDLPCTGNYVPEDNEYDCAPNGQAVYEVPFSCVWSARGEFLQDTDDEGTPLENDDGDPLYTIEWHKPMQLTSGTRDANKIWLAASEAGFAETHQEDPVGLRAGKGMGPGSGWSGATTNHGADIWFTKINMEDFAAVEEVLDDADATKPKSLNNFDYPVRVTDNEKCNGDDDTKLYCAHICDGAESEDCVTEYIDMLSLSDLSEDGVYYSVLDGDTGASRPAMQILKTDLEELVVVMGYEETKGLAITDPGVPNPDQGVVDPEDTIADEGKSVYFESFRFPTEPVMDLPLAEDDSVPTFRVPVVSAGYIVNQLVPEVQVGEDAEGEPTFTETDNMIFENARRLVIMTHVDNCEADEASAPYTFGFMYKQGIYTQGGPSDMYIRLNTGFTYADLDANELFEPALNVSSHEVVLDADEKFTDEIIWDPLYMTDHLSWTVPADNTFSPRGWLRGADVFTAFEYTPSWDQSSHGCLPNKFHFNATTDGAWINGPMVISKVRGPCVSTLDPRIKATPKGKNTDGIVSDLGNPDVIHMAYGTYDMETGEELDIFYTWSHDRGLTWDVLNPDELDPTVEANRKVAARTDIQEKEAQIIASPDGTKFWTIWNQEYEHEADVTVPYDATSPDHFLGLDSWTGRVDFELVPEVAE